MNQLVNDIVCLSRVTRIAQRLSVGPSPQFAYNQVSPRILLLIKHQAARMIKYRDEKGAQGVWTGITDAEITTLAHEFYGVAEPTPEPSQPPTIAAHHNN